MFSWQQVAHCFPLDLKQGLHLLKYDPVDAGVSFLFMLQPTR